MDFRVLVWKRVWKIKCFGLKSGQDLKNRAAHPTPTKEYPPPSLTGAKNQWCERLEGVSISQSTRDDKIYDVFLNVKVNHINGSLLTLLSETNREATDARRS